MRIFNLRAVLDFKESLYLSGVHWTATLTSLYLATLGTCCLVAKLCLTLLRPRELYHARLLCPWDSPGKNTGVGCHFLLQGIFLTQESNPCLLHWQAGFFFTTEPPGQYFLFKFNEENCLILICINLIIMATEYLLQLFAILLLKLTYLYFPHPSTVYSLHHLFKPML